VAPDDARPFEMAHRHVNVPAIGELHGDALGAERRATMISEESQDDGPQAHESQYTVCAVRQASRRPTRLATARVSVTAASTASTRGGGTPDFLARQSRHSGKGNCGRRSNHLSLERTCYVLRLMRARGAEK
jgi:hypothetical protein